MVWGSVERDFLKSKTTSLDASLQPERYPTEDMSLRRISDVFWSPGKDTDYYGYLEDVLENAPDEDYDICSKGNVFMLGIGSQKIHEMGATGPMLDEDTEVYTTLTLEDPGEAIPYHPGRFYDPSLGSFFNSTEEDEKNTAQYPYAEEKCENLGVYHYTVSGEDYRVQEANNRPIRKHALDDAYHNIDKMGLLFFGYKEHPWTQAFNNQDGENDDGDTLVDPDWEHYDHPQWARIYARTIGSEFEENNPSNDDSGGVFKNTKLITVNGDLVIHDGQDEIIKIETDKVTISNSAMTTEQHELDIYTPNCCWSRDPDPKWKDYGNVAIEECSACFDWMKDAVERIREGFIKYKFRAIQLQFSDKDPYRYMRTFSATCPEGIMKPCQSNRPDGKYFINTWYPYLGTYTPTFDNPENPCMPVIDRDAWVDSEWMDEYEEYLVRVDNLGREVWDCRLVTRGKWDGYQSPCLMEENWENITRDEYGIPMSADLKDPYRSIGGFGTSRLLPERRGLEDLFFPELVNANHECYELVEEEEVSPSNPDQGFAAKIFRSNRV